MSLLMCSRPTTPPDEVKDATSPAEWHGSLGLGMWEGEGL